MACFSGQQLSAIRKCSARAFGARYGNAYGKGRQTHGAVYDNCRRHPQSWFPTERSAEELVSVTDDNRLVGYPYPKYLNSVIRIDQAAAVVMTSVGRRGKWVLMRAAGSI
ncbi:MAG: hypothetical protein CM15mP21_2630 [Hyphomicrobiales bacterium]|nr:MAG: hypothetical protein CM15mP21_2630 [Hyphomicrobiales bacterium]